MPERIETARLILSPLEERDLVGLAAAVNNRRIVEGTGTIPWPYDLDDARAHFSRVRDPKPGSLHLAIRRKERPHEVAGTIGHGPTKQRHEAELGYWLAEDIWGQGLGFEAARAVAAHAFGESGHDRLVASYRHGNEASRRILDRLGFRLTGHGVSYSAGIRKTVPVAWLELTGAEWLMSHPV